MPSRTAPPPPSPDGNSTDSFIQAAKAKGKKKENRRMRKLKDLAKWFPRKYGPFLDLRSVIYAGVGNDEDDEEPDADLISVYDDIVATHPDFMKHLNLLRDDEVAFNGLVETLSEEVSSARTADTHTVRYNIASMLAFDPLTTTIDPPLVPTRKFDYGWHHLATAQALTPLSRLEEFREDPKDFCNRVLNGTIQIGANEFPSFLYPDGTTYDKDNEELGLFRGHVLIRVLRAIYTGMSSTITGCRTASRESQSELHGMREVFPCAVAYAAVQAHFALSSTEKWSDIDHSDFDYSLLFANCKALLENTKDPWVMDTTNFINSQLPSLKRKKKRHNTKAHFQHQGANATAAILQRQRNRIALSEASLGGTEGGLDSVADNADSGGMDVGLGDGVFCGDQWDEIGIDPVLRFGIGSYDRYSPSFQHTPSPPTAPKRKRSVDDEDVENEEPDRQKPCPRNSREELPSAPESQRDVQARKHPQVVRQYGSKQRVSSLPTRIDSADDHVPLHSSNLNLLAAASTLRGPSQSRPTQLRQTARMPKPTEKAKLLQR